MKLNVFFGNEKAGILESTENRGVVYVYDKNYLLNKNALPLSASLPLHSDEFSQKQCILFFSGLLPEEDFLLLAEKLNIKNSVFSKIFDNFWKKYINAFEELRSDEKVSSDVLDLILSVIDSKRFS